MESQNYRMGHVQNFSLEQNRRKSCVIENALNEATKGSRVKDSILKQYDGSLRIYAAEAFDRGMDVSAAVRGALERILKRKRIYGARKSALPPIRGEKRRNGRTPGSGGKFEDANE